MNRIIAVTLAALLAVALPVQDAEAKRLVMEGPIGFCFNRYLIPIWRRFGMMDGFAKDAGIDPLANVYLTPCTCPAVTEPGSKGVSPLTWVPGEATQLVPS